MQILLANALQLFLKAGVSDVGFLLFVPVNYLPDIHYLREWPSVKLWLWIQAVRTEAVKQNLAV